MAVTFVYRPQVAGPPPLVISTRVYLVSAVGDGMVGWIARVRRRVATWCVLRGRPKRPLGRTAPCRVPPRTHTPTTASDVRSSGEPWNQPTRTPAVRTTCPTWPLPGGRSHRTVRAWSDAVPRRARGRTPGSRDARGAGPLPGGCGSRSRGSPVFVMAVSPQLAPIPVNRCARYELRVRALSSRGESGTRTISSTRSVWPSHCNPTRRSSQMHTARAGCRLFDGEPVDRGRSTTVCRQNPHTV